MSWLYRVPGGGVPTRGPESLRELVWPFVGVVLVFGALVALGTCTAASEGASEAPTSSTQE